MEVDNPLFVEEKWSSKVHFHIKIMLVPRSESVFLSSWSQAWCPWPSEARRSHGCELRTQERLSDLIGPYWGTYQIGYRVLQPLLDWRILQTILALFTSAHVEAFEFSMN